MKAKTFVVLSVFVLGSMIVFSVIPRANAENPRPNEDKTEWIVPNGAEFPDEQRPEYLGMNKQDYFMYSMLEKYKELTETLKYLYEKGEAYDFYRMGLLLERQAAVIKAPEGAITGMEEIAGFLAHQKKKAQGLIFDEFPLEAEVSTIQKIVEGYLVDRMVHLKFKMHFHVIDKKENKIIENETLDASLLLMHRNMCKPDG